jgi:hypothetical protein
MEGTSSAIVMLVVLIAFLFPIRKLFKAVIDWLNRH